ncbi:hypothetical protein BDY24DRAFT_380927 [Mrakia frigida]|uniref:CUE domain-containing protein n=1 Tax=Mrakia frigida TaxID=29902 RepID=UPI003FCC26F6
MSDLDPTTTPVAPPSTDPKIASLQAMFPTVEESILKEVLQAHGNNDERAVESLLAMTDESFVPEERPGEDVLRSQSDLDEDFARSLALQDENDAAAHRQARSHQREIRAGGGGVTDPSLLPYQPRVRRGAPPPPGQGQNYGYGADTQERGVQQQNQLGPGIEEQFNKIAVEGKKAFTGFMASGFMKSVQAKVANATTGGNQNNQSSSSNDYNYPVNPSSNQYPTSNPPQQYSSAPRTQNPDYPASDWSTDGSFTPTSDASSINIYHPSPTTHNAPIPPTKDDRNLSSPPSSNSGKRSDEIRRDNTGGRQSPNMLGTSPPVSNLSSSPSARIDFAKLGLLPKQKISLDGKPTPILSPSSSPVPASATPVKVPAPARKSEDNDDDDDDALSYTANPFEDEDRR